MSILEMDKLSCRHLVMTNVVMTNEKKHREETRGRRAREDSRLAHDAREGRQAEGGGRG
jgi:hypothetical protein